MLGPRMNGRRWIGSFCGMLAAMFCGVSFAQEKPPVEIRAEQCLNDNVDRVVAVEPDIQSAASFLLTFVCAEQVEHALRYRQNLAYLKLKFDFARSADSPRIHARQRPQTLADQGSVDPETGDLIPAPPNKNTVTLFPPEGVATALDFAGGSIPSDSLQIELRKLTAELVLDARERQLTKRH